MKKIGFWGILFILLLLLIPLAFKEGPDDIVDSEEIIEESDCDTAGKKTEAKLKKISDNIENHRTEEEPEIEQLKEHLNQGVLTSKTSVREELEMLQKRECIDFDHDEVAHLKMYESLLEYYYTMMENDEDIHVDELYVKELGAYFSYKLVVKTDDENQFEIANYTIDPYYYSEDWGVLQEKHNDQDITRFLNEDIMGRMLLVLADPFTTAWDQVSDYFEWDAGIQWEDDLMDVSNTAKTLDMGFFAIRADSESSLHDKKIQKLTLEPTERTYDMFERLKEIADDSDEPSYISYPADLIESEDWEELEHFFEELDRKTYENDDTELYDYIVNGTPMDKEY